MDTRACRGRRLAARAESHYISGVSDRVCDWSLLLGFGRDAASWKSISPAFSTSTSGARIDLDDCVSHEAARRRGFPSMAPLRAARAPFLRQSLTLRHGMPWHDTFGRMCPLLAAKAFAAGLTHLAQRVAKNLLKLGTTDAKTLRPTLNGHAKVRRCTWCTLQPSASDSGRANWRSRRCPTTSPAYLGRGNKRRSMATSAPPTPATASAPRQRSSSARTPPSCASELVFDPAARRWRGCSNASALPAVRPLYRCWTARQRAAVSSVTIRPPGFPAQSAALIRTTLMTRKMSR